MSNPYTIVEHGPTKWHAQELLIASAQAELPDDLPPGSVAYTADLSYMAMWDGTEWKQIGGDD
ncbi:MAG: hypothetical protein J6V72_10195 [Kiritimatiellae bacterium]|nr:hypothetical protein [Kiritimatiellia bacterium]